MGASLLSPLLGLPPRWAGRLDADPEFWEGKRGAAIGVFQRAMFGKDWHRHFHRHKAGGEGRSVGWGGGGVVSSLLRRSKQQ
eukprot:1727961-Pyramimonas_sp.AAC.1